MTPDELDALLERATPGPWEWSDSSDIRGPKGEFRAPSPYNGFMLVRAYTRRADPTLMTELRNLAPLLLDLWRAADQAILNGKWDARGKRVLVVVRALHLLAEHTVEGTP